MTLHEAIEFVAHRREVKLTTHEAAEAVVLLTQAARRYEALRDNWEAIKAGGIASYAGTGELAHPDKGGLLDSVADALVPQVTL